MSVICENNIGHHKLHRFWEEKRMTSGVLLVSPTPHFVLREKKRKKKKLFYFFYPVQEGGIRNKIPEIV